MGRWISRKRFSPIGVDFDDRSVKLVQFDTQQTRLVEAVRWELRIDDSMDEKAREECLVEALRHGRNGRAFRGRDAVLCLGGDHLLVQNVRVPKASREDLTRLVYQEAAGRMPYPVDEAEVRYLETADVRQADTTMREVIVFACHRPEINRMLETIVRSGLRPVAVDVQPAALLRCYAGQGRRHEDHRMCTMFVHIGTHKTAVIIAEGERLLFVKYVDVGGDEMDTSVARNLNIDRKDAAALRRRNSNRQADQQDREVARSVNESIRPVISRLVNELSMCLRYHSVTFRKEPVSRVIFGGGEASKSLVETLGHELGVFCELGDPFRDYSHRSPGGRKGQWDVATGLALRKVK